MNSMPSELTYGGACGATVDGREDMVSICTGSEWVSLIVTMLMRM